jgi:hypothetical protein
MKHWIFVQLLCAALTGCAQILPITEIKPLRSGFDTNRGDPVAAMDGYLVAAESAWRKLERDPAGADARRDYNFAVARIFGTLRESKLAPWSAPIKLGTCMLGWQPHPLPVWNPELYELIPTDQLDIRGAYVDERETKDGLGAPLVAKRKAGRAHDYAPTPHFFYAATGIVRFDGSRCVLALEDPLEQEAARVGAHAFPLAADYTAPLAMMLVEMHPEELELPRLLHPARFAGTTRIARLEPFDPDKTVGVLVQGQISSQETWLPLINHLRTHNDIRLN